MISRAILEFDDLRQITGYHRLADVERCLHAQGVRVFRSRAGIWTTIDLVNAAAGLKPAAAAEPAHYDPALAG